MILSDVDILKEVNANRIKISPVLKKEHLGGMSIDLQLGGHFRVFKESTLPCIEIAPNGHKLQYPMTAELMEDHFVEPDKPFYLHPGELALGITIESISLPNNIVGFIDGRSSLARLGLMVNITAHTIEAGWEGNITLEFANLGRVPLALYPRTRICALRFEQLSSPAECSYDQKPDSRYHRQTTPLASKISE